jgi:ribosomal protein S17E
MKEVANDTYNPPQDGRLTDNQVAMYLKVREHEKKIAQVAKAELEKHADDAKKKGDNSIGGFMEGMKALGSAADFLTADIRAAKDLGYNTQEYLWVKQQIMAASTAEMAEQFSNAMAANFDKAYAEAKKAHDEAADEQTKKLYADVLAGYDKSKQEMTAKQDEDPAIAFNKQLLSKYESALNAFAHEMSKYEDKPGEAQKAVEDMQKQAKQQ